MIVFKVELNGELVAEGGKENLSVLTAIIGATGALGCDSLGMNAEAKKTELRLNLGGLGSTSLEEPGNHYRWTKENKLNIGDQVTVTILEQSEADDPIESMPSKSIEDLTKEEWERSKKVYFDFKDKYEEEN